MSLNSEYFLEGFLDAVELHKNAAVRDPSFPASSAQAKWQYARFPEQLRLMNNNQVYSFKVPQELPEEGEVPTELIPNITPEEFAQNATEKGFAQVHRSDPASLYFTLQEGLKNPTFTLKQEDGKWKLVPKKKMKKRVTELVNNTPINPQELLAGLKTGMDKVADIDWGNVGRNLIGVPIQNTFNFAMRTPALLAKSPLASTATGLGLGALYDLGRRAFYNTKEENQAETGKQRLMRYLLPTAGLGIPSLMLNSNMAPGVAEKNFAYHPLASWTK